MKSLNPEASWKVITGVIEPDLMDTLIRSYVRFFLLPPPPSPGTLNCSLLTH